MVLTPVATLEEERMTLAMGELVLMVRFEGASSRKSDAVVRFPLYMQVGPRPIPIVKTDKSVLPGMVTFKSNWKTFYV